MNEELRSSAEELETSKEELQSVNEELTTVNQELKIKIEELAQANNDFQNLINSTDIGAIFLDRSRRIKLFTPRMRDMFNLIPADRGRPLSDITTLLVGQDLPADVARVLERLERVEREVAHARRPLAPDACPAVPHRGRSDRRRGADVRRHHRAAPDRGAAAQLRGAPQRHRRTVRRRHRQPVGRRHLHVRQREARQPARLRPRVADRARADRSGGRDPSSRAAGAVHQPDPGRRRLSNSRAVAGEEWRGDLDQPDGLGDQRRGGRGAVDGHRPGRCLGNAPG